MSSSIMPDVKDEADLDWIQIRKDLGPNLMAEETTKERMARKMKENPFVPIGM